MDKAAFTDLFINNVQKAREKAEAVLHCQLPKDLEVLVYAPGSSVVAVKFDDVVDQIYISETAFYKIIDVSVVREKESQQYRLFVRVSGHDPVPFEKTLNVPEGNGPFNVMTPAV
jgi:hypothetical protein